MEHEVKKSILAVLKSLKRMLESDKIISYELKKLSNALMEDVSLFQDQDSISIAVLVYSLYKVFTKNPGLEKTALLKLLKKAINAIEVEAQFRTNIRLIFNQIKKYDKNIDTNIIEILRHAHIKKGLKVYEHGLSIGQAAEIIGISKWDLMDYLGNSHIVEKDVSSRIDNRTRLSFARGLFK